MDSLTLLVALKKTGYIKEERDPYWWPHSGTFECFVSTILTQNTKWQNVEKALANLQKIDVTSLNTILKLSQDEFAEAIKPSGFYNTKSKRILELCKSIQKKYGDFQNFRQNASREWLLNQKGLGEESVDAILNYVCYKDEMVVDSYTGRLLNAFGYEFESYGEIKEWLQCGIDGNLEKVYALYRKEIPMHQIYARFHGKIVEYVKDYSKNRIVDISPLKQHI